VTRPALERAVAAALGEPIATVRRLGFGPAHTARPAEAEEPRLVLDCPFCRAAVAYPGRSRDGSAAMAECDGCDIYFDFDASEVYATGDPDELAA
jgi:hypothetical protein